MADPFEVRMRFTAQLKSMNASINSAQKAAHYALKYRELHEDLHSCIIEQLELNSMNTRANIMYFIEHLCDISQRYEQMEFVRMMQRDIFRVVDAVAPSDGSGAANVKVARKVLVGLLQKSVITQETHAELEASLKERDTLPTSAGADANGQANSLGAFNMNGLGRLDKRQIEQRIEEDRERHKRLKESIWGIEGETSVENAKMYEEGSDIGEDDILVSAEDETDSAKIGNMN